MTDTPDVLRAAAMIRLATANEQHAQLAEAETDARLDLAATIMAFHDAEFFAATAGGEIDDLRAQWTSHIDEHGCHDWVAGTCPALDALIARRGDLTRRKAQRQQERIGRAATAYAQALAALISADCAPSDP